MKNKYYITLLVTNQTAIQVKHARLIFNYKKIWFRPSTLCINLKISFKTIEDTYNQRAIISWQEINFKTLINP